MLSLDERRRRRDALPRTDLLPRHVEHGRLLASREALLDVMPKHGVVAEIGVSAGDFSTEILGRCAVRRLHLIDLWIGPRYAPDLDRVRTRFAGPLADGLVEVHRGLSVEVLAGFPAHHFDWVYLDSDHAYGPTMAELHACRDKVRPGGMIAGHDYCTGNVVKPIPYGVIAAVNRFCVECDWTFVYLTMESHGHASFCIRANDP